MLFISKENEQLKNNLNNIINEEKEEEFYKFKNKEMIKKHNKEIYTLEKENIYLKNKLFEKEHNLNKIYNYFDNSSKDINYLFNKVCIIYFKML